MATGTTVRRRGIMENPGQARTVPEAHGRNGRMQAMLGMATSLLRCVDVDEILSTISRELRNILAFDRLGVALLSPDKRALALRDIRDHDDASERKGQEERTVPLAAGNVIGWVASNREAVMRHDIPADTRFEEMAGEERVMSDMTMPLIVRGELIGTLNVGSNSKNAFTKSDLDALEYSGAFVALAIERITLLRHALEIGDRYRFLQDNSNDIILLVDKKNGKVVEANRKSLEVFKCSLEAMLEKSYIELFARDNIYQARKDFIHILSERSFFFPDRKLVSATGEIVCADINTNLVTIRDETYIQVMICDISHRKELEKQITSQNKHLQQVNRKLREVDSMKREFLANISHELRTPLSIILAYSESMRDESISHEDRNKFLDVISENGETLLGLINNLLDLSRLEISGAMLNVTLAHVHDVIRSIWPQTERAAREKGITLSFQPGDDIPIIYFDTKQIMKVISCLLHNAIKFTNNGGSVRIITAREGDEVHITVSDTGMGIPYEAIPHIFATFHQVDGSSSRKWGGMGIGLSLAKHIVGLHNGRLWVDSEVDKGSEFTVALPVDGERHLRGETESQELQPVNME